MKYSDDRDLTRKLEEHRKWNTLELDVESAADDISKQLLAAVHSLKGSPVGETSFSEAIETASLNNDADTMEGLVRLAVLCCNETPNRFKALFPAYLIQEGLASVENDRMKWSGFTRLGARLVTIETLVKSLLAGHGADTTRRHFAKWVSEKGGFDGIDELVTAEKTPAKFIYSVSLRLAQGADTNKRGHAATDIIKERLGIYGLSPTIGNTNTSDIAVSELVAEYSGPRKFDTVVWNALGEVVLVCQSQMYSSDVGSIQGKTVEEDYLALTSLRARWSNLTVLTNTEGFGCHTTMLSRLKHVLNSEIDGFIQLRTLDNKLRHILREQGCATIIDFECALFCNGVAQMSQDELVDIVVASSKISNDEANAALKRYVAHGMLTLSHGQVGFSAVRLPAIAYFAFIDKIVERSSDSTKLSGEVVEIGGCEKECAVPVQLFEKTKAEVASTLAGFNGDIARFEEFLKDAQIFENAKH